jgi:hypothetical protein
MKTLQINSMPDTNTVYSEIGYGGPSTLDKEMPDFMKDYNGKCGQEFARLERAPSQDSMTPDPLELKVEIKIAEAHFKSRFPKICFIKNIRKKQET